MFDYIIVGAGFAGSVLAERIATQLNKKVLIIEKHNHIGGHCFDFKDQNNIIVHKYGPHLFHTNSEGVFNYLSNFTEWNVYQHEVLSFIDGTKVPLPFNFNTLYALFPKSKAELFEKKLLTNFKLNTKVPILDLINSEDNDLQELASYIYEKVFLNYTAKQWGKKPEEIDKEVTNRVPIFIGKDNRYFNDTYQVVPKYGYTKLFENLLSHKNIKLLLNTNFKEIGDIKNNTVEIFGSKFEGILIYTGRVDELFGYKFGELPYRSVDMHFETIDCEYYQEKATVNYPNNYNFTRITEFKHIHPVVTNKTTILKEYPAEYKIGVNEPYYPLFTEENKKKYQQYADYSKNIMNLILLGRLAEYKYYDMDDIVERSLEVFEERIR